MASYLFVITSLLYTPDWRIDFCWQSLRDISVWLLYTALFLLFILKVDVCDYSWVMFTRVFQLCKAHFSGSVQHRVIFLMGSMLENVPRPWV